MTDKPWKLVLLLTGIFFAGAITGGVVTVRYGRQLAQMRAQPEQWGPARLKMLAQRLDLTPEQVEKLRPIIKRDMEDLNRLRQHGMSETRRVLQRMEADITAELTPEQKGKFEKLTEEIRAKMQRDHPGSNGPRVPGVRGDRQPPDGPPPPPTGGEAGKEHSAEKQPEKPSGS